MKKKVDIPCHITECDANEEGFCRKPSAIIIEETGVCQTGLEQMEKKDGSRNHISQFINSEENTER